MANNNPITICSELNKLLNELLKFLSNERNIANAPSVRSQVNMLIEKLKIQSRILAQVKELPVGCDGDSYVDMKSQQMPNMYVEFENPKDDIYTDISDNVNVEDVTANSRDVKDVCPYMNRKYSDFANCRKKGILNKREKVLFFDTNRKYYGVIHENYFLLYINETDGQPTHAWNLHEFNGRGVEENPKSFFLINKLTRTPYIFLAISQKDKLQWLAAINGKRATHTSSHELSRPSINSNTASMNTVTSMKHESRQSEEIYEMLEEEYGKVDNKHLKIRNNFNVKPGSKPLPKLPSSPAPPLRPKVFKTTSTVIKPTTSSDADDDENDTEATVKSVDNDEQEEDNYDIVCAPRLTITRPPGSVKARTADLAFVHPSVITDLNRRFNMIDRSPLLKKTSSPIPSPKNIRCSSAEYYDSIEGSSASIATIQHTEPSQQAAVEEDIYDSVVNVMHPQNSIRQPETIDELKSRLNQMKPYSQNVIKPKDDYLKKPIIKPEVKVVKTKATRKKYSFFKEASPTKIV